MLTGFWWPLCAWPCPSPFVQSNFCCLWAALKIQRYSTCDCLLPKKLKLKLHLHHLTAFTSIIDTPQRWLLSCSIYIHYLTSAGYRSSKWSSSLWALPWQHPNKCLANATIHIKRHERSWPNISKFNTCILRSFSVDWECGKAIFPLNTMVRGIV